MSGFWIAGRVVWSRNQLVLRLAEQSEDLRRGRAAEARALAAEQRERIARDVHDVVAHSVSLMVVQAEAGEAQLPADAASAECLRAIQRVGRSTLTELRGLLSALGEDTRRHRPGPARSDARLRAPGCATRTCWSASWRPRASRSTSPWKATPASSPRASTSRRTASSRRR